MENPNPKTQTPTNSKFQIPNSGDAAAGRFGGPRLVQSRSREIELGRLAPGWNFGLWNLFGIWDLDFGISAREFSH